MRVRPSTFERWWLPLIVIRCSLAFVTSSKKAWWKQWTHNWVVFICPKFTKKRSNSHRARPWHHETIAKAALLQEECSEVKKNKNSSVSSEQPVRLDAYGPNQAGKLWARDKTLSRLFHLADRPYYCFAGAWLPPSLPQRSWWMPGYGPTFDEGTGFYLVKQQRFCRKTQLFHLFRDMSWNLYLPHRAMSGSSFTRPQEKIVRSSQV